MSDLNIPTAATFSFVPEALQLAMHYRRTVYDSIYIVLASHAGAELITADERLANSLAAHFPIKWLGAF